MSLSSYLQQMFVQFMDDTNFLKYSLLLSNLIQHLFYYSEFKKLYPIISKNECKYLREPEQLSQTVYMWTRSLMKIFINTLTFL